MAIILGLDEAGYGPNIGPLTVACSVWRLDSNRFDQFLSKEQFKTYRSLPLATAIESLCQIFQPFFQPKPIDRTCSFIPLGDSKKIYLRDNTFESLAIGLQFWYATLPKTFHHLDDLIAAIAPSSHSTLSSIDWYRSTNSDPPSALIESSIPIPAAHVSNEATQSALSLIERLGLTFLGIHARIIDEKSFNEGTARMGNKAHLLSHTTLNLASDVLAWLHDKKMATVMTEDEPIFIYCDKHGGRNRYQAPLTSVMPEIWFDIVTESENRSDYRAIYGKHPMNWTFMAKGDSLFASAVASMMAKWLREMLMHRLNAFWKQHLPNLAPTAGYPVDAKRFANLIRPVATQLGYSEDTWWRCR